MLHHVNEFFFVDNLPKLDIGMPTKLRNWLFIRNNVIELSIIYVVNFSCLFEDRKWV